MNSFYLFLGVFCSKLDTNNEVKDEFDFCTKKNHNNVFVNSFCIVMF